MARTIIHLGEDQWQNVVFSLDEPRGTKVYPLLLPTRFFDVEELDKQTVLKMVNHGLTERQEVAVGCGSSDSRLPAGLQERVPYFVQLKGPDHFGLTTQKGEDVKIHDHGDGERLLFAWPQDADVCRLPPVSTKEPLVRAAGQMLFRGLVRNPDMGNHFITARDQNDANSICLSFGDVTQRMVEAFPWEAMYHPDEQFLALKKKWPIVRLKNPQASIIESFAYDPPLRIFAVLSATGPYVDPRSEWEGMYSAVQKRDVMVKVLTCEPELIQTINGLNNWRFSAAQTLDGDNIREEFRKFTPQVLHLFGHGDVNTGELFFGNLHDRRQNRRGSIRVAAATIRQFASETLPVWITILNACRSAGVAGPESFTSALARSGFPVVIGMSTDVASQNTEIFARTYYRSLMDQLDDCPEWKRTEIDWASRLWKTRVAIQEACEAAPEECPQWTVPLFYTRVQPFRFIRLGNNQPGRTEAASIGPLTTAQTALNSDSGLETTTLRAMINR